MLLEVYMKIGKKLAFVLMAFLIVGLAASCASTGQYMPLSSGENVIGTIQSTFVVGSSLFFLKSAKDAVNMEAYIHLMEVANQRYSGNFDIRDIVWVTGKSVDNTNTEISATGKVVQVE
jgi:hypothetical protein